MIKINFSPYICTIYDGTKRSREIFGIYDGIPFLREKLVFFNLPRSVTMVKYFHGKI